jgi:predicted dehydrogenase
LIERTATWERPGVSPLGVALVGYGRWGSNVARDLALTEGAALTHVVDVSAQALACAARAHPAAAVSERLPDVLGVVDAVAICTPPETHAGLAREALGAGKHVFVEKPFAMDAEEAEALEALSSSVQRVIMVGHQMLYHTAFEDLRRVVASGELGALRAVHTVRAGMVDATRDPGALWAYGPHDVAMILALAGGKPRAIRAAETATEEIALALEFEGGLVSESLLAGRSPSRSRRLTAICERGELVFDDSAPPEPAAGTADRLPLARELADFVACALRGGRPRTHGGHAAAVTRVLADAGRMLARERSATSSFRWSRALS